MKVERVMNGVNFILKSYHFIISSLWQDKAEKEILVHLLLLDLNVIVLVGSIATRM